MIVGRFILNFVKLNVFSADTLVAIYSGQLLKSNKPVIFSNMTKEEIENVHKNYMNYNDKFLIDVPPSLTDFRKYRASLAHKVNLHLIYLFISDQSSFWKLEYSTRLAIFFLTLTRLVKNFINEFYSNSTRKKLSDS